MYCTMQYPAKSTPRGKISASIHTRAADYQSQLDSGDDSRLVRLHSRGSGVHIVIHEVHPDPSDHRRE